MMRVLFVDDEPRILEGLQRMLRPQRHCWDMTFSLSGEEALRILAESPFDVIVTDMRMPGMDGAQLLDRVREEYPEVIRIVLSGYFDEQAAIRAVPVAHKFLMKPCTRGTLQEAIDSSCGWRSLLSDSGLQRIVGAMGELPTRSHTSSALLTALEDPNAHWEEIGQIVEQDVGVAAKVLQLVNSAFFHLAHEVSSISVAVSYLGLDLLRQLVLSVEVFRSFPLDGNRSFSMEAFQNHSRLAARVARELPVQRSETSAAVIASFLHDAGKLVLAARMPEKFDEAVASAARLGVPLHQVEFELYGTTHAQIGAYLLGLWGMPSPVIMAIAEHHKTPADLNANELGLNAAVYTSDLLATDYCWQGKGGWLHTGHTEDAAAASAHMALASRVPEWRQMTEKLIRTENWT